MAQIQRKKSRFYRGPYHVATHTDGIVKLQDGTVIGRTWNAQEANAIVDAHFNPPVVETPVSNPVTSIDPTTPAGATREGAIISAIERGWTEAEIEAGVQFKGRETFVCPGCGVEMPRSLGMNASTAFTCPDCFDDFS